MFFHGVEVLRDSSEKDNSGDREAKLSGCSINVHAFYERFRIIPSFERGRNTELSKSCIKKIKKRKISTKDIPVDYSQLDDEVKIDKIDDVSAKIVIETAHIYTDHTPSSEHRIASQIGNFLSTILTQIGYKTEIWLLIDDIPQHNPKGHSFDLESYLSFLDLRFTRVIHESELLEDVKKTLENLHEKKQVNPKTKRGKEYLLRLKHRDIELYNIKQRLPTCALLDATFCSKKLLGADYAITVLPTQYKSQQSNTKEILKELDVDTNKTITVFFSPKSSLSLPVKITKPSFRLLQLIPLAVKEYLSNYLNQQRLNSFIYHCKEHVLNRLEEGDIPYSLPFNIGVLKYAY